MSSLARRKKASPKRDRDAAVENIFYEKRLGNSQCTYHAEEYSEK